METTKNSSLQQKCSPCSIAGILFAVLVLDRVLDIAKNWRAFIKYFDSDDMLYIFGVIGLVVITVGLLTKKKGIFVVGISLYALYALVGAGFCIRDIKRWCRWFHIENIDDFFRSDLDLLDVTGCLDLLNTIGCLCAALFSLATFPNRSTTPKRAAETVSPQEEPAASPVSANINPHTDNFEEGIEMSKKFCSHCGSEIFSQAVVCPNCGCAVETGEPDVPNTGLNILALLFPIVGLILYLVYHDKTPNKANKIGQFALIGFCIGLFSTVILFAL